MSASWCAADLIEKFGGTLVGDGAKRFDRVGTLLSGDTNCLSFFANPKYRQQLLASRAGVIVLHPAEQQHVPVGATAILSTNPYLYFARATSLFVAPPSAGQVHPTAVIDPTAELASSASVGAFAVVGARSRIEADVVIGEHCVIGTDVSIQAQTRLHARVTIYAGCQLGQRCIVHSGAVIGADGFGFAPQPLDSLGRAWQKIEQLGAVRIGDDVEIGANTTIDRGAIEDTVIERGCKLDNQIQIAHNVHVGENTVMAACVGVAGSASIGKNCQIGGSAGILGHLSVADGSIISAMSLVTKSIAEPGMYTGIYPLMPNKDWERSAVSVRQLDALRLKIKELEKLLPPKPPID